MGADSRMQSINNMRPAILIAITGPTASGKSTLAKMALDKLGKDKSVLICQDNYYKDRSSLPKKERKKINFDDIKSFDLGLLVKHLKCLKNGKPIFMSLYDFIQSRRLKKVKKVEPKPFIIVEGLMPFFDKRLRKLFDFKIYIDLSNAICLSRRIKRDTKKRGESIESVCLRYFNDVLPMQKRFVEPQRQWADVIING